MSKKLTIGLIDADLLDNGTRHPNLAQMKISSYCKSQKHNVRLIFDNNFDNLDYIVVSKVFNYTKIPEYIESLLNSSNKPLDSYNTSIIADLELLESCISKTPMINIGGTGFFEDGGRNLDDEIEHIMPDYHLYDDYIKLKISGGTKPSYFDDYLNYSIGFASRGCFRRCSFCVNKKYKAAFRHAKISEFLDPTRNSIYLWDDNVFALQDEWADIFKELEETGKTFQFRQGLDIRLIDKEKAKVLSKSAYHGDFIFAFDHIEDKDLISEKLRLWKQYSYNSTTKLYVLCAYDPTVKLQKYISKNPDITESELQQVKLDCELKDVVNTLERIKILMEFGCLPYIMRFEAYNKSNFRDLYVQLARWCNQPEFFKKKSFKEFCVANQLASSNLDKNCRSYQAFLDFESKYPEISDRYFSLKYEDLNHYSVAKGFAKTSIPCIFCNKNNGTWANIDSNDVNVSKFLCKYFQRTMNLDCLNLKNSACKNCNTDVIAAKLFNMLSGLNFQSALDLIDKIEDFKLKSNSIIQVGKNFESAHSLLNIKEPVNYEEAGEHIYRSVSPDVANDFSTDRTTYNNSKIGETYSKFNLLADTMDLVQVKPIKTFISPLGKIVKQYKFDNPTVQHFYAIQIMRMPIIQNLLRAARYGYVSMDEQLSKVVSSTTIGRRKSSISALLDFLKDVSDDSEDIELKNRIDRIG